jgi:hypothetical protein
MFVNNLRLKDPAEATSLAGIMTKICACAESLAMVAAMVTEITSSQNQNANSNACSLEKVEVNVKILSDFHDIDNRIVIVNVTFLSLLLMNWL